MAKLAGRAGPNLGLRNPNSYSDRATSYRDPGAVSVYTGRAVSDRDPGAARGYADKATSYRPPKANGGYDSRTASDGDSRSARGYAARTAGNGGPGAARGTPAEQPATDSPSNDPGALLAMLPAGASQFIFVDIEAAMERSAFRESVEFQLGHFVNLDEIPLAEELLRSIGVSTMALGNFYTGSEWACILSGDFALVQGALRLATAVDSGGGLSANMIDAHREVEIFSLVRNTSRSEIQVYLAIPDRKTLAASQDLELVKETIDRHRDGLSLPQSFAVMLEEWGHPDYLDALRLGSDPNQTLPGPLGAAKYYAFHATLGENATTTMRALQQFSDDDQAAAAAAWLGEQEDSFWQRIGYGSGAQIDQWRAEGQSVYGEVKVADEDFLGLIQTN